MLVLVIFIIIILRPQPRLLRALLSTLLYGPLQQAVMSPKELVVLLPPSCFMLMKQELSAGQVGCLWPEAMFTRDRIGTGSDRLLFTWNRVELIQVFTQNYLEPVQYGSQTRPANQPLHFWIRLDQFQTGSKTVPCKQKA